MRLGLRGMYALTPARLDDQFFDSGRLDLSLFDHPRRRQARDVDPDDPRWRRINLYPSEQPLETWK